MQRACGSVHVANMLFSIDDLQDLDDYLMIMEKWLQVQHEKAGLKQVHLWDNNDSELLGMSFLSLKRLVGN